MLKKKNIVINLMYIVKNKRRKEKMRKINTTNAETLAGVHTNNLVKSKRKNIGANLYSCFDICQEVRKFTIANNEKTDNGISSICMPLKRKEQIYDRRKKYAKSI